MAAEPTDPDIADFLDDVDWKRTTVAQITHKLVQWERWLEGRGTKVLDADRGDLRAYLRQREDAGKAPATRKKEWQAVQAFYGWAARAPKDGGAGILATNPMAGVKPPHVSSKPATRRARNDEFDLIVAHLRSTAGQRRGGGEMERARRNLAMVSLMFRTGLRPGELPALDVDHVITRPDGHVIIKLLADNTKSQEPRYAPLSPETQGYLKRYLRVRGTAPGPLFIGRYGKRLTSHAVSQVVERAAQAVGVPVTAYQLRRGFTSNYLRSSGGDVLSLEVIGGWADHRMPRRYLADDEAEAALDRFWTVTDDRH